MHNADDVLSFWFEECAPADWWGADPDFDARVRARFADTLSHVARGEAFGWRARPEGRLAEIIVLDQFSRQLHRNSPLAFANDGMALALAQEAVAGGHDTALPPPQRGFLYMPFMHSESLLVHQAAAPLFAALGVEEFVAAEAGHIDTLTRFGRYPKRNAALGRSPTEAELAYLAQTGDRMF